MTKENKGQENRSLNYSFCDQSSQTEHNQVYNILDNLEAIVYVADMKTYEILFANKYTRALFGDVIGEKCWQALQANQTGPCSFCTNNKLLNSAGEPVGTYNWELNNTANGRFYDVHDKAITWVDGRIVRLEIALDKTDRKQFEETLSKSEEKFHTFADYTYDWEYWVDSKGDVIFMSPSCQRVTGYSADEFSNNSELLLSILHDDDRVHFSSHMQDELEKEKAHNCDFKIFTRTGDERWISHICQPVFGEDGNYLGRRVSNRDITKRKLAEAKVIESEAKFKSIFNNSSIGIALTPFSEDVEVLKKETHALVNPAMQKIFGYSEGEIQQKTLEELSAPEDMEKDILLLKGLLGYTYDNYKIEKRFISKNGQIIWGNLSRSLIKNEQGSPFGIVSNIEDISERKATEKALQSAHNELEGKVAERTRDLASANQKLEDEKVRLEEANTALKVLLNHRENDKKDIEEQVLANVKELIEPYVQKLQRGKVDEKQKKYLEIIDTNLHEITSPFVHSISSKYLNLTPSELQVANLVKQGLTSCEIAEVMNLSPETVSNHRKKIRKKSGITNQKMNLRTLLSSLS